MSTDGPLAEAEEVKPEPCRQGEGSRIQQAKKSDSYPQFLQIVAKPSRVVRKVEAKPEPKLTRVAFAVSRLMEFCNKRELQNQTGHSVYDWPLVVTKELFDNALDACEEAEVAPDITVIVEQDRIIVQDNANGIDAKTIESILDYAIRVSSREAYVSPTRGSQGNALKTILAMGYVLQGAASDAAGVTTIETSGVAHRIEFRVRSHRQPAEDHPYDGAVADRRRQPDSRSIGPRRSSWYRTGSGNSSGRMSGSIRT